MDIIYLTLGIIYEDYHNSRNHKELLLIKTRQQHQQKLVMYITNFQLPKLNDANA